MCGACLPGGAELAARIVRPRPELERVEDVAGLARRVPAVHLLTAASKPLAAVELQVSPELTLERLVIPVVLPGLRSQHRRVEVREHDRPGGSRSATASGAARSFRARSTPPEAMAALIGSGAIHHRRIGW
jgi:hypothetical protein